MRLMNIAVLYLGYPEQSEKRLLGGIKEIVSKYMEEEEHSFILYNGQTWTTNGFIEMYHSDGNSSYYIDILHSWKDK